MRFPRSCAKRRPPKMDHGRPSSSVQGDLSRAPQGHATPAMDALIALDPVRRTYCPTRD